MRAGWLVWAAGWAGVLVAQEAAQEVGADRITAAARETVEAAKYCFLITVDAAGEPQARLMEPLAPEADLTVWMGTKPDSRKVAQIRKNPRASLACYHAKGPDYVTLIGRARIVEDLAERRRRWRPGWEAFYPGGPEGKSYVLIELTPSRVEVISHTHTIAVDSPGPAMAVREKGRWVERAYPGAEGRGR